MRTSEAHAVRRADRYKKEAAKTRESLQALEELHEKAKVTISIQSGQLSGKVEPETPHRQRSLQLQATPQTYRNQHALVHQAAMAQPPVLQHQNSSNVSNNTQYGRPGPSYPAADVYSSVSRPPYPSPAHNQLQTPPQAPYEASAVVLQRQGSSNMSNTTQYTRTGPSYPAGDVFSSVSRPPYAAPAATQRPPPPQASYDVSRPSYPGPVATQLPPPPQASYDATAVVPHRQSAAPQQDFKLAFNEFFADIENWARKWAGVPNPEADQKLTPQMKAQLSSVCDRSIALLLLSDPATRYFLVARVISDELTHQLKITVIKGFNAAIDARVQQVKDELHSSESFMSVQRTTKYILTASHRCLRRCPSAPGLGARRPRQCCG